MIKNVIFTFFNITLLSLISGCGLYGPTYTKPKVATPKEWKQPDTLSKTTTQNLPSLPWWEKFHDKQLSILVDKAIQNNNDIQVAVGNVVAAKGEFLQIQMSWIPSVSAFFGYAATPNSTNLLLPGYNTGFMANYILNLLQFIRSNQWARAKVGVAAAAKDAVILTVISQTVGGYFAYLGQSQLLLQQKQLVSDLQELLQLSKRQYTQGLISLYTLQQYEQQYEQAKSELPIMANNVVVSSNALKLLLNENPGNIGVKFPFQKIKSNGIIPVNLPSQVLQNRPDVRGAEQQLMTSTAQVGIVTSTFFPTISLTGVNGTGSSQLGQLFSTSKDYWHSISLGAMPLLDPAYPGQFETAQGQRYAALRNYVQVVRSAFKSVSDDLSAHQQYYDSYVAQGKNFSSSKKAYNLAQLSYKQGLYSYPTLLVNKINYDKAAIDLTKSKLAQLNTIVQLYQDLGAGYAFLCRSDHEHG